MAEPLLTVREVAAHLKVTPDTVRRWLREGRLRGVYLGERSAGWRIEPEELQRFIVEHRRELPEE